MMGLRVRKKKNQSGSISVQIVDRTNRGYKVVETLGCSDDEIEIDKLHQKAILRINDLSQNLFSKSLDETSEKLLLKKLLSKLTTQDFIPIGDELIFGKIFNNIGCNNLFNNVKTLDDISAYYETALNNFDSNYLMFDYVTDYSKFYKS